MGELAVRPVDLAPLLEQGQDLLGLLGQDSVHRGPARRAVDELSAGPAGVPASLRFTEHLEIEGIKPSIGSIGDAFDNALMETINGLYKAECIRTTVFHDGPYKTIADVEYASRRLGRLVQPATPPRHPWHDQHRGVRERPLRDPQPRAAAV